MIEIRERLYTGMENVLYILTDFIEQIPEKDLKKERSGDIWTITEHIDHIVKTQPMLYTRLEKFKNEENPQITPYFPDKEEILEKEISVTELLERFTDWRKKQLDIIRQFTDSDWQKNAIHPEYKKYNLEILIRHIFMHDYWHLYRIEELWLTRAY